MLTLKLTQARRLCHRVKMADTHCAPTYGGAGESCVLLGLRKSLKQVRCRRKTRVAPLRRDAICPST